MQCKITQIKRNGSCNLIFFIRSSFETWNKMQSKCVFFINFWIFQPALYSVKNRMGRGDFCWMPKAQNLLSTICWLCLDIILQTNRLSNSLSAYVAGYSLNLLRISGMSNVCKLHKHYQNIMFNSMFNIFLVNRSVATVQKAIA